MLARVQSYLLEGIDALPCEVEVDLDMTVAPKADGSMPRPVIVGLPDAGVKESVERVKAALANSGYQAAVGRLVINLAPADIRKEGPTYDLPIAVGILLTQGVIPPRPEGVLDHRKLMFAGELALDGRLRPIKGVIALAALARARGLEGVIVPDDNADEASVVPGLEVHGARTLTEVVGLLTGAIEPSPRPPVDITALLRNAAAPIDFLEVRGQESVKRAITIAAAGGHNLLMLGPPGSGKTMMAKALPGVLPPLSADEAIEVTRIYSAAGQLPPGVGLVTSRPVRSPHHTASPPAIVGGGMIPRPGEISLAHHGVLFLDELAEFPRVVLETLRQPLEDHVVTIARAHGAVRFPASFMLIAALNPTPKGDMPAGEAGRRAMEQYLSRLSGPLLDRIDMHVEAPAVPWKQLAQPIDPASNKSTSSESMRAAVSRARARQHDRQGAETRGRPNARLSGKELDKFAILSDPCRALLGNAMTEMGLSARAYDKIRRVSRTIADLESTETITPAHVSEAISYRLLDRKT